MRGGKRAGAGRPKGAKHKGLAEKRAAIEASGLTPLEWMLSVLRDPKVDNDRRDKMARDAAPFVHPRLATVEHGGKGGGDILIKITSDDAKL